MKWGKATKLAAGAALVFAMREQGRGDRTYHVAVSPSSFSLSSAISMKYGISGLFLIFCCTTDARIACRAFPFLVIRVKPPLAFHDGTSVSCSVCTLSRHLFRELNALLLISAFFFSIRAAITSYYSPLIIFLSVLVFALRTGRLTKAHSTPPTSPSRPRAPSHTSMCAFTRARHASNLSRLHFTRIPS